jgi:hypothetical protein
MKKEHLGRGLLALVITAVVGLGLATVADPAEARPRARVNVWVGGPFWWGIPFGYGYGYPYVVERPVIVQTPAEPMFMPSATQQSHSWYYCREAQMYYPYATSCPSPWQEVPATPEPIEPAATTPATPSAAAPPAPRASGTPVPPAR